MKDRKVPPLPWHCPAQEFIKITSFVFNLCYAFIILLTSKSLDLSNRAQEITGINWQTVRIIIFILYNFIIYA
jgi:hypothetical protein